MPSKFLRGRTAAVAALALLSIGAMAATASALASASAERAATAASSRSSGGPAAHEIGDAAARTHGPSAAAATNSSGPDTATGRGAGPDASGAAKHGLCQAWSAGQGDDHGKRADASAFQALAAAAGGADQVAAYCEAELADAAAHGERPAAPAGSSPKRTSPPTTGPPEEPGQGAGQGNGQGGPPTTT
jgi:hypothetical protein